MTRLQCNSVEVALFLAVWLFTFGVLFLTYAGYPVSHDERALFDVASRWERRGVYQPANPFAGYMEPMAAAMVLPWLWLSDLFDVGRFHAAFLTNIAVAAWTTALLYITARRLGFSRQVAWITSLYFALGTGVWPYSQRLFREPIAGLFLLLAIVGPYLVPRPFGVGFTISALGFAAATLARYSSAAALPGVLWVLAGNAVTRWEAVTWKRLVGGILGATTLVALVVLGIAGLTSTLTAPGVSAATYLLNDLPGYLSAARTLLTAPGEVLVVALHMTVSPGKGLIAYSPALVLALVGLPLLWRKQPELALGIVLVTLSQVVGYSAQRQHPWWGGLGWGPRYLLPTVAPLMVAAAPAVDWLRTRRPWGRVALIGLGCLSPVPQLAGSLVDIRAYEMVLSREVYEVVKDYNKAMVQIAWDLKYNPILGQWQVLGPDSLTLAWLRAQGAGRAYLLSISVFGMAIAAIIFYRVFQHERTIRSSEVLGLAGMALFVPLAAVLSLRALTPDPRLDFTHNARFLAPLVEQVNQEAVPGDAFIVTDPLLIDYSINWLRAPVEWMPLESTPPPIDERTRDEMERVLRTYKRVWLMRPLNRWSDGAPGLELFLLDHAYKVKEYTYLDWMRLLLFLSPAGQEIVLRREVPWQNGVKLVRGTVESGEAVSEDAGVPVLAYRAGDSLKLGLVWRGTREELSRWKVFVHIGLPDRPPLMQQDRQPRDGWLLDLPEGKAINVRDRYGFELDLPPGRYWLRVGLYDPETGERVLCPEGDALTVALLDVR